MTITHNHCCQPVTILEPIEKLRRDIRTAAVTLSEREARYLVDSYYIMQDDRKRAHNQERSMDAPPKNLTEEELEAWKPEPHEIITWLADNSARLERSIKNVLESYAESKEIGQWSMSIVGIGPVIAAGLMAYIDIEQTPGVTNLWAYAGLSPEAKWEKGQKRPWNAGLKTLCWKAGESFIKTQNHQDTFYGPFYQQWKPEYERRNANGDYAEQAAEILASKRIGKDTEAYKAYSEGKLPQAQIHARARRKVVKLFLSHWWETAYRFHYGRAPENRPYVFDVLGHKDYIAPPN